MAEENKDQREERNAGASEAEAQEEEGVVGATYNPDGAAYVLQETSYKLNPGARVVGEVPKERFMEEVLRDSDEAVEPIRDAHPEENRPMPGIGPDDELPDTTGRAANQALKKNR